MKPETEKIYQTIINSISVLDRDGILDNLHGNCVLAADILQSMLYSQGIASAIVECQLTISRQQKDGTNSVHFIGYDFAPNTNQVSTHAVVVTRSDPAVMIDASIGHFLGNRKQVVITVCDHSDDADILATNTVGADVLTYRNKKSIKLASYHQKDIMQRLQHEYDTLKNIRWLRYLIMGTIVLSATNFVLNVSLLTIKILEHM